MMTDPDIDWLYAIGNRILHTTPINNEHKRLLDKAYAGISRAIEALEALQELES